MIETELLKKISDDLDFLKNKILEIDESLEIIDTELHPVKKSILKG